MFRHPRRILTILILLTFFRYSVFPRLAHAQEEESFAPWKMTELDQLDDLTAVESNPPKQQPAIGTSSSSYSFHFAGKFQYANPRASDAAFSPYRQGMRGIVTRFRKMFVGVALEKDPGERQYWDHASIAASFESPRNELRFILGDYRVHFGGGLVIRTARNYGLPYGAETTLFSNSKGIQAYCGWDENIVLRGGAVEGKYRVLDVSIWGSRKYRDALLDSTGNIIYFSSTGLHRTEAEMSRRNACSEEVFGVHIGWNLFSEKLRLGSVAYGIRWDHPNMNAGSPKTHARVGGVQVDFKRQPVYISLEAACDDESNAAMISALRISTAKTRFLMAAYYVDPEYFAPLSAGIDFDFGNTANREGVYVGLELPRLLLRPTGFCHVYHFPRLSPYSSRGGQDLRLQISQMIRRPVFFSATSRWVQEDEAAAGMKTNRWVGAASIQMTPDAETDMQTEIRLCRASGTNAIGELLRMQFARLLRIASRMNWRGGFSAGIYNAENALVKLYWFDVDWNGNFFLRQLQGRGAIWQLEMTAQDSNFGKFGWILYWDVTAESGNQASYYTISVNYQFP